MRMNFFYQSFSNKIFYGAGQLNKIDKIITNLGGTHLFIVAGHRHDAIVASLSKHFGDKHIYHFLRIVQHVPRTVVEDALRIAHKNHSDILIAIGGGSAIGLVKAMALQNKLPIVAVPTTYAGSEMTNIFGISSDGVKTVGRDLSVLPSCVIYDPSMTVSMPLHLAATSSMNAMAHLIEALYAHDTNPLTYQFSLTGIKSLTRGMEILIREQSLENANDALQFGSFLAGKALCDVSMSLHHKLAHVLGGSFNLDHSKTHTVLLPYVVQAQMPGLASHIVADLKDSLNDPNPAFRLRNLAEQMGAPISLKEIDLHEDQIPDVVRQMLTLKFSNPVPVNEELIREVITDAFAGKLRQH